MLHIYTGNGKGKTTAAIGQLVRAAGAGKKCAVFPFLKNLTSSEYNILKSIPNITVINTPDDVPFVWEMKEEQANELRRCYKNVFNLLKKEKYDIIVLDEAVCAITEGFISEEDILNLCDDTEIIITGRGQCDILADKADYITVMQLKKHPFEKSIKARKGIEY